MNDEIRKLFEQDQADRKDFLNKTKEEYNQIEERDNARRARITEILASDQATGEDFYRAAYIFQHSLIPEDILKAQEFAQRALELGFEQAKWIFAAATDRYLMYTDKPQKYGTQYKGDGSGEMFLYPIDPETTDEERAEYGIKPLAEIPKKFPGK